MVTLEMMAAKAIKNKTSVELGKDVLNNTVQPRTEEPLFFMADSSGPRFIPPPSTRVTATMAVAMTWLSEAPEDKMISEYLRILRLVYSIERQLILWSSLYPVHSHFKDFGIFFSLFMCKVYLFLRHSVKTAARTSDKRIPDRSNCDDYGEFQAPLSNVSHGTNVIFFFYSYIYKPDFYLEKRWPGTQPHRCESRHSRRTLVEQDGRKAGHRPRRANGPKEEDLRRAHHNEPSRRRSCSPFAENQGDNCGTNAAG